MKLLFRQRLFSWFDSYDIYGEDGSTVFTVEGKLSWGRCLHILDRTGNHIGTVKQVLLTFLPRFDLYLGDRLYGTISRKWSFFRPSYSIDCNGWSVDGGFLEWNYSIRGAGGGEVAVIRKELLNLTDTYTIDVADGNNALLALMVVLAIDAEKCSRNK